MGEGMADVSSARQARVSTRGPALVARKLADAAELNDDELKLVALFVYPMQQEWEKRVRECPELADSRSNLWANGTQDKALLPLGGMIARVLFVGGGGCGKSRVITRVLAPLLKTFYGSRGLMLEAQSNKAARGIGGVTLHAANKLRGSSSLITVHLRAKPRQKAAMQRYGRLGAKLSMRYRKSIPNFFMPTLTAPPSHVRKLQSCPISMWCGMQTTIILGVARP